MGSNDSARPAADDLIGRYLPEPYASRLPRRERAWRGRTVLLLWGHGYPLVMAWCLAMTDDPDQSAFYRDAIAALDDARLVQLLEATGEHRRDADDAAFAAIPGSRTEVLVLTG